MMERVKGIESCASLSRTSGGLPTAPNSGRANNASSRSFVGSAQQSEQAAARRRTQEVGDGDQQRERHAGIEAEKGHGDDLEVLQREGDRRDGEQNDDGEVDPAHGCLLIVDQPRGAQSVTTTSTNAAQAEAQSDPASAGHDEIDAKEQAENIEARDRPSRQNQEAEQ